MNKSSIGRMYWRRLTHDTDNSDRSSSRIWVLGFGLEPLLIHKLMTTSGSIFLAGASRGVGHQIACILATQNLPVLALTRDPAAKSDLQALDLETVVGDALNPIVKSGS